MVSVLVNLTGILADINSAITDLGGTTAANMNLAADNLLAIVASIVNLIG